MIYVLHDATNPEAYGGLPKDPHIPWVVRFWKGPAEVDRESGHVLAGSWA